MAGKVVDVPMDATMRDEFVTYIYKRWCETVDRAKAAREMKFDRVVHGDRVSYAAFRADAIATATAEATKWTKILDEFKQYSPLIRGE